MDHLMPFSYQAGKSLLHHLDVRLKFFMVCLISISMVQADPAPLLIYAFGLIVLFKNSGINGLNMLKNMKLFLLLLVFVFVSRSLSAEGKPIFKLLGICISPHGLYTGFLVSFKFLLIMMTGMLFAATTRPSSVKHAVQWYLKPVPFIPEKRVAVIISIALSFMPRILKQRQKIVEAQKSRCGDLNRNPVKKIIQQVLPMLKKTFLSADQMILAMESRCFSDDRTDPEFIVSRKERPFLLAGILMSILLWLL